MDKKKIEEFATTARKQLIQNLTYEANRIGITPTEIQKPTTEAEDLQTFNIGGITNTLYGKQIEQRNKLIEEIENKDFEQTIEKIAYTWFNRIIAIRFMEINNYLPTHTRVLSSITPEKKEPDIITEALNIDLNYTEEEIQQIYKYKTENQTDKLFKLLFIKQCNKLNEILPELFETIDDYTEILFNIQLSNENNIINKLITTISEEDFTNQIEIIGWMYQYYNKELKDETYKKIKEEKYKVGKDRLPAVTQLFTPDWIVKYLVENSLGRLWIEKHKNDELKQQWQYYLDEVEQTEDVNQKIKTIDSANNNIKVDEIKILDPSMGSGHILVYVFEVLMQIYTSQGYTEKEATKSILENNIYGIDIDDRAYQLAYFAIMMKARSYYRNVLNEKINLNLISIQETEHISDSLINMISSYDSKINEDLIILMESFSQGKTTGSITNIPEINKLNKIQQLVDQCISDSLTDVKLINYKEDLLLLKKVIHQTFILKQKYDIIVTNPPYFGNRNMDDILKNYLKKYYKNSKNDLFAVFLEKGFSLLKSNGFNSMVTMQSWMSLKTYEKLRSNIFKNNYIINLLHMGNNVMGIAFGTSATIFKKGENNNYNAMYTMINFSDLNENLTPKIFPKKDSIKICNLNNFKYIPGMPIAYGMSDNFIRNFNKGISIDEISDFTGSQNKTANNNKFLRFHWEISNNDLGKKWIIYAKGGKFRKYYGNLEYVVDWSVNAQNFYKNNKTSNLLDEKYRFKEGITYTSTSSKGTGFRYLPKNTLFDMKGPSIVNVKHLLYIIGFLNSKIAEYYLKFLAPTMDIQVKNIKDLPIIIDNNYKETIEKITLENINISKNNWDNQETSLDFNKNVLLKYKNKLLKKSFAEYAISYKNDFEKMKKNEIKLNEIFKEIYNLSNEIEHNISNEEVTLFDVNKSNEIKSFISYVVGCIFGRFSLDDEGLIFAGGEFDINNYHSIVPDEDNVIPVLDEEYFDDDIVNQIVTFVSVAFGNDTLEENLDFIAESLDVTGKTSREVIRNYMIKNFYSNHTHMYQNCPIYWQFDSGKENAFKCLIYMHRYEPDLVSRIRFDYLHKTQRAIEENIKLQESIINESDNKSRVNKANKKKTKLIKQLDEIKLYDLALAHVANERIEIDLDDGVKVNYAKFQNIEVVDPNTNKTKKINLLKKI